MNKGHLNILSVSLAIMIVGAEIGPYVLYKAYFSHIDPHNHPHEASTESASTRTMLVSSTTASTTTINGDQRWVM